MDIAQLIPVFVTGLLAGGFSCMAVQGGLLATTIAQRQEERLKKKASEGTVLPIISFLAAKLFAYTILGALLGWLGASLQFSVGMQIILQLVVGLFMLATALHMFNVHPIFRYVIIQPPRFIYRLIRKESKSSSVFAPAVLGAFTVFIPCGTTQAIMALSIASGNPLMGAALLFAFVLGTSPIFFLFGYFTAKLGEKLKSSFARFTAFVVLLFALFNLNNAVALTGTPYTLDGIAHELWCTVSFCQEDMIAVTDHPIITINDAGYSPRTFTVRAGQPVTLRLDNAGGSGCTQAFTIPQLGLQKIVPVGKSETVNFTAPNQPGQLSFMCSMGMYRGTINVI